MKTTKKEHIKLVTKFQIGDTAYTKDNDKITPVIIDGFTVTVFRNENNVTSQNESYLSMDRGDKAKGILITYSKDRLLTKEEASSFIKNKHTEEETRLFGKVSNG